VRFLRSPIVAVLAGAATWTATEYGLHRFAMHSLRGRGLASREHLSHHADVTYFSPASKKLLSAAATTVVVLPIATSLVGRRRAVEFTAGMVGTYAGYEVAHRRNHGVTTNVWDRLFGSYDDPGVVTVPRRMAPVWLLDQHGEVRDEFAADYTVRGAIERDLARARNDRSDAFANIAPAV
jgi:hypothetical protein